MQPVRFKIYQGNQARRFRLNFEEDPKKFFTALSGKLAEFGFASKGLRWIDGDDDEIHCLNADDLLEALNYSNGEEILLRAKKDKARKGLEEPESESDSDSSESESDSDEDEDETDGTMIKSGEDGVEKRGKHGHRGHGRGGKGHHHGHGGKGRHGCHRGPRPFFAICYPIRRGGRGGGGRGPHHGGHSHEGHGPHHGGHGPHHGGHGPHHGGHGPHHGGHGPHHGKGPRGPNEKFDTDSGSDFECCSMRSGMMAPPMMGMHHHPFMGMGPRMGMGGFPMMGGHGSYAPQGPSQSFQSPVNEEFTHMTIGKRQRKDKRN